MLNIKNKLKEYGITQADFAKRLKISRPTLDSYINFYQNGELIPNSKYQEKFEALFSEDVCCREDFEKVLYSKDELDDNKSNILDSVISQMRRDMKTSDCDEDIYIFINMLIRSYRKEKIFKKLARYFLLLNANRSLNTIKEEEEIYLSNYFKLFYEDKNNLLKTDKYYLEEFYKRAREIEDIQKKRKEEIKKKLIDKINEKVQEKINLGIDMNNIEISDLLEEINLEK